MTTRPPPASGTSIVTANRCGRTSAILNEVSEAFVAYAAQTNLPVLDVGAAYGVATGRFVHAAGVADVVADGPAGVAAWLEAVSRHLG